MNQRYTPLAERTLGQLGLHIGKQYDLTIDRPDTTPATASFQGISPNGEYLWMSVEGLRALIPVKSSEIRHGGKGTIELQESFIERVSKARGKKQE